METSAIVHALDALRSEIRALTLVLYAGLPDTDTASGEVSYWQRDSDAAIARAEVEADSERDNRAT